MDSQQHWDAMYEKQLEEIPWEIQQPPSELVELVATGSIKPCKTLDIACGTGNYALFLAKKGFSVTGVDISKNAISSAKEKARDAKVMIRFICGDILTLKQLLGDEQFEFVLDYSIMHHIDPAHIEAYTAQFSSILSPKGTLLLVCYSEEDAPAVGQDSATGKFGNTMYYRTAEHIRDLYKDLKVLSYKKTRLGKQLHHAAHCFLFER